jgi:hypothetical protein
VNIPGLTVYTGRAADISEDGAGVCGGPSSPVGTRGMLHLASVGIALPFSVRSSDKDMLHLIFDLDEATSAKFRAIVERLDRNRAA